MSRIAILNLLVIVLLVGVCCAIPSPCTNLRLVRDHPTLLQYHLVWDAPSSTSNSHFRVRCVQGCEAYTSVQWDAYTPSSKVPVDVLLRSHPKGSRAMRESNGVRFVLAVTHVDGLGLESLSVDTILFIDTDNKDLHAPREEPTSSTSSSLTSGSTSSTTTSLSTNSTSNATSSTTGQLTSGTSTSLSTTGGYAGEITINIKFAGNVTEFDPVGYGQVLARALGVPSSLVRVQLASRKRADSFTVVVRVTYPAGTTVPSNAQVSAALTSPAYATYLQENNLLPTEVNISIVYGPIPIPTQAPTEPAKVKKQKEGISGGIIAAIVVPIVVVVAVIVAVVIVLRVRRRRWEQRGIELEQIYKSF